MFINIYHNVINILKLFFSCLISHQILIFSCTILYYFGWKKNSWYILNPSVGENWKLCLAIVWIIEWSFCVKGNGEALEIHWKCWLLIAQCFYSKCLKIIYISCMMMNYGSQIDYYIGQVEIAFELNPKMFYFRPIFIVCSVNS